MENDLGQPIGPPVPGWAPRPLPAADLVLEGRTCRLEAVDAARHAEGLHAAFAEAPDDGLWTYMPYGPWADAAAFRAWADAAEGSRDPCFLAIIDRASGLPFGVAAYLRMAPEHGAIEVGSITYSPVLARTTAATEAMALMAGHVFDLGYRRYEWKCNALNGPSRRAAERLGFTFEGIHRQAAVVKGRNRDTAWYSILDTEWPAIRAALTTWLDPANFDPDGLQRAPLDVRAASAQS